MNRARLSLLAGLAILAGCPTTPTNLSGQFERPSGMIMVPRPADGTLTTRADLFVADAEAGGVRVVQMRRILDQTLSGTVTLSQYLDPNVFVRAPALFFPLVVGAGAFPTAVALSSDQKRLFVLSPVDGVIFILDASETAWDTSITEGPGYAVLGRVDLSAIVGLDGHAVDVEALPGVQGTPDTLLVALDPIGSDHGEVVALSLSSTFEPRVVASATVSAAPRRLTVRTATPAAIFASSAAGPTFTMLPLSHDDAIFGAAETFDAGGPTADIVDADTAGVVALRLDAALAVIFDRSGPSFAKSTRLITSPGIADAVRPGEVTLPASGVIGRTQRLALLPSNYVDGLKDATVLTGLEGDGKTPVVMIVHQSGGTSLLLGNPLRAATGRSSSLTRLEVVGDTPATVSGCNVGPILTSCEDRVVNPGKLEAPECAAEVLNDPDGEAGTFRASYRGAIVKEEGGTLTHVGSSTSTTYRITPYAADATGNGFTRIGDLVLFQLATYDDCMATGTPMRFVRTGTVTGFSGNQVILDMRTTSTSTTLPDCPSFALDRWELYPGGEDLVFAQLINGGVLAKGRVAMTSTAGQVSARLPRILSSTLTFSRAPSCALVPLRTQAECATSADCGGRMCASSFSTVCLGHCEVPGVCVDDTACKEGDPVERVCSGVELTQVEAAWIGQPSGVSSGLLSSVPDEIVVSPIRSSWLISFPGGRSVVEIKVNDLTQAFEVSPVR